MNTSQKLKNYLINLKLRRKKKGGVTQQVIASEIGCCAQSLTRWENNGFKGATVGNFLKYVEALEKHGIDTQL